MPARASVFLPRFIVVSILAVVVFLLVLAVSPASKAAESTAAIKAGLAASYGKLPLSFEANSGQTNAQVKFLSRGSGYGLFLTADEAVLSLNGGTCAVPSPRLAPHQTRQHREALCANSAAAVRMRLLGSSANAPAPTGEDRLPGTANYFLGSNPSQWRSGLPTFSRVHYAGVYPGVDLIYYGNQRQLEYDFVVAPGADPGPIRLQFAGIKGLRIDSDGNLILAARTGEIAFHKPVIYQQLDGRRQAVSGRFTLMAHNTAGFALGNYDRAQPLVIDPVLSYSTFLGGASSSGDLASAVAVDSEGNAYVTGQTASSTFPLTGGSYQQTNAGAANSTFNAFVTKLNATGTALVYSTYLGGSQDTRAFGIAVDSNLNAYVTGSTFATDFPHTPGAYQTASKAGTSGYTAFVTKLNPAGSALVYSTYLGGSGNTSENGTGDSGSGIAVDASGDAYVAGYTYSNDFPTSTGAFESANGAYANKIETGFITELNPAGGALIYSSFLGGSGTGLYGEGDTANAVAVDSSLNAYVTGETASANFPTTFGAFTSSYPATNGPYSAFVTKFNPTGTALVYSTFLGGTENSGGNAIAVDSSGYAYVAGEAFYTDFPTTLGSFEQTNNAAAISCSNAFVTKLNQTGTSLEYSTWLGGSGEYRTSLFKNGDSADAIAVDSSGDAYVAGIAFSSNFPTTGGAFQTTNYAASHYSYNAFFTELNPGGTALLYSTYIGGSGVEIGTLGNYVGDNAAGLALDGSGGVYLAGTANSAGFPVTVGAYQLQNKASSEAASNAFVSKFEMTNLISTTTTVTASPNPASAGTTVVFTATVAPGSGIVTPTGNVEFTVDTSSPVGVNLNASGVAQYTLATLSVGTHTVTVSYPGSATFNSSASSPLTETITLSSLISTTTAIASSANPQTAGSQVTFTATVTPASGSTTPTGSVTFTVDGSSGSPVTLNGGQATYASSSLSAGTHAIGAAYSGSSAFSASASSNFSETINAASSVATPTFNPPGGSYTSTQSVTISDTTSRTSIYYTTDGSTPVPHSSPRFKNPITVSASETINAIAVTSSAESAVGTAVYNIGQAQTITFGAIAPQIAATTINLSATASSGLAVSFASLTPAVCTVSGTTASLIAYGSCTIQATQAGNTQYLAATPVPQTFSVQYASQTITFGVIPPQTAATALNLSATATSGLAVSFASLTPNICAISNATASLLAFGSCTIQASQAGNGEYSAAAPVPQTFNVQYASQFISFQPTYSQVAASTINLYASSTSGLTVSFASLTSTVCTVSGATASLISYGSCTIKASQAGNGEYLAASPVSETFSVGHASQTISFPAIATQTAATNVNLSATASSGLSVSFTSTSPTTCTVSGTTASLIAAGFCSIQASQAGNNEYFGATTVTQQFGVSHASQTIAFGAIANQIAATNLKLSATASSGFPVSFASSTPTICTVSGTSTSLIAEGFCTIEATQAGINASGNSEYFAAPPVFRTFGVGHASQNISFPAIPSQVAATTINLVATASSGLPVTFTSTTPAVCTVSASQASLIAEGFCGINVAQAGNSEYFAAPTVGQEFGVAHAPQTISFPIIPTQHAATTVNLAATATSGLPVTFTSTTPVVCTISGNTASLLASGFCGINAGQAGNQEYRAAPTVSQEFGVSHATQTITFASFGSQVAATTLVLAPTATSGLPVKLTSATPTVCTVNGTTASLLTYGFCTIDASAAGNSVYSGATATLTFGIGHAKQTITFAAIASQVVGTPLSLTATASSGLPVSFISTTATVCTVSGTAASFVTAGSCTIQASQAGNATYAGAQNVVRSFTVAQ